MTEQDRSADQIDEDAEGHVKRQWRADTEQAEGDEVEGHASRAVRADAEQAEDDVEGHAKKGTNWADAEQAEGDDVEGHNWKQGRI